MGRRGGGRKEGEAVGLSRKTERKYLGRHRRFTPQFFVDSHFFILIVKCVPISRYLNPQIKDFKKILLQTKGTPNLWILKSRNSSHEQTSLFLSTNLSKIPGLQKFRNQKSVKQTNSIP